MTREECTRARDNIAREMQDASIHLHVYVELRRALLSEKRAYDVARTFWASTLNGHLAATHLALAHLYDQEPKALGLRYWLQGIHRAPEILDSPPEPQRLEEDLARVGSQDPEVKRFVRYRGSNIAHISAALALDAQKSGSQVKLRLADYEGLLARARQIVSRYSVLHDGSDYAPLPFAHSDFERVVAASAAQASAHSC